MYSSNKLIQHLLFLLKSNNIRKIVISPGSRHFPLTHSIENDSFFQPFSVVDERSAAFFALGLIQQSNEAVAICCSSGTAVANYGSAVCEAFYQKLPLLLLTADRITELLGQKEDQMIKQDDIFREFIKYHGQLPEIKTDVDEWYANRIINEAMIELFHHGAGPVQLNYRIYQHKSDTFSVESLPNVRKITYHNGCEPESNLSVLRQRLSKKRIMIVWGQSVPINPALFQALDQFCQSYNCVILTDRISNCTHKNAVLNSFVTIKSLSLNVQEELTPDIVITLGGNIIFNIEIKDYLFRNAKAAENWQVGPERTVCDAFRILTDLFEINEVDFFEKMSYSQTPIFDTSYFVAWKQASDAVVEPQTKYSQLYAVGSLIKQLPQGSVLQLANSNAIRMAHLFHIDKSIKCFCNRGVNGIDGSMSTAVGYAAVALSPVFLIIGDLSFFYDMNALWNRHLSTNIRILLINNEGGSVMHLPFSNDMADVLTRFTSAGHVTSAKGWVESVGVNYYSAHNKIELDEGLAVLTDKYTKGPVLLEVFTKKEEDASVYKKYMTELNNVTITDKAKQKANKLIHDLFKH